MFRVRTRAGVYLDGAYLDGVSIVAEAATLHQALGFIGELCAFKHSMIETHWQERDGQHIMDVYDWCDCWFVDPPVLAQIIAPPDFKPPGAA